MFDGCFSDAGLIHDTVQAVREKGSKLAGVLNPMLGDNLTAEDPGTSQMPLQDDDNHKLLFALRRMLEAA